MLTGRTAVITGGAQGIGLAIARTFADHGARIVIGDLDEAKAKEAAASLSADAIGVGCNVTSAADMAALLAAATAAFGSLDVMVNNAGITRDATMRKMTEQQFDDVITVHLRGCWNGTRQAAGIMREIGRRLDHQHVVDLRQSRIRRPDQLLRGQGGHRRAVQGSGQRGGPPGRSGQRHPTGPHPHRDDRGDAAEGLGPEDG